MTPEEQAKLLRDAMAGSKAEKDEAKADKPKKQTGKNEKSKPNYELEVSDI